MTAFELTRYLNYCSEMLSLTNKLAAVYAQHLPDSVVIDAVNDIETLTTNLSGKIWQKITIIDAAKRRVRIGGEHREGRHERIFIRRAGHVSAVWRDFSRRTCHDVVRSQPLVQPGGLSALVVPRPVRRAQFLSSPHRVAITQLILSSIMVGMVVTIPWVIVEVFLIPGWVRRQNNLLAEQLGA